MRYEARSLLFVSWELMSVVGRCFDEYLPHGDSCSAHPTNEIVSHVREDSLGSLKITADSCQVIIRNSWLHTLVAFLYHFPLYALTHG